MAETIEVLRPKSGQRNPAPWLATNEPFRRFAREYIVMALPAIIGLSPAGIARVVKFPRNSLGGRVILGSCAAVRANINNT